MQGRVFFLLLFAAQLASSQTPSYSREIVPLLSARCQACHQASNLSGQLNVSTHAGLLQGGKSGPAVVAGKAEASPLYLWTSGEKPRMPKFGEALSAAEQNLIRRWIEAGAPKDGPAAGEAIWWSLKPLEAHPTIKTIDGFIAAKLKAQNLSPTPEASRRTLIRRLYFDLHGLPPTPAEVEAFMQDPSAKAYESLVERLLASPRYGERWGRHWLDIVHYGDSHGYDKDKPRPNAWPYRDAVIRAFNTDIPYARFIQQQIAGDVLFPNDPQAFASTGFLAAGPWDFVGHQELRERSSEKELTRLLDRDDMVATTMSAFTSMTAHCARCHNHKFDPIPQADYYSLQAVFAGIDRADRPYDIDAAVNQRRQALLQQKQAIQLRLQPLLDQVEFTSSAEIVALDDRIQDAGLLLAHLGVPKNPADVAKKHELEARRAEDRKKRQAALDALLPQGLYPAIEALKAELAPLDAQLASLPAPQMVYSGASFFSRAGSFRPSLSPRPVHVLDRGSLSAPGPEARAGALSALPHLAGLFRSLPSDANEGQRRAALAQWISHPENPLTWRSIVNRVWHYHFGSGLVDTPSDFGRMGSAPTHPELLDFLALYFRDEAKGSFKQLHRLILLSQTYRQASTHNAQAAKIDADNRLLWRMNRSRLDAEAIRDSALAITGQLDLRAGGPADRLFVFKDDHSPVYDYGAFDPGSAQAQRRSIYRFIVRSVPDPFFERLDCPDPSVLTPKRSMTLTAIQALALLNNPFMVRMAQQLAARVERDALSLPARIQLAAQMTLNRGLSAEELSQFQPYAQEHGLANLCRLLLNANEFHFID
jgi:hypothetical protein